MLLYRERIRDSDQMRRVIGHMARDPMAKIGPDAFTEYVATTGPTTVAGLVAVTSPRCPAPSRGPDRTHGQDGAMEPVADT